MAESLEVVGEGYEAGFDVYFFNASEGESSESFVLFYVAEHRFYLPSLSSFLDSFLAFEQFFYFLTVAVEVE